MDELPDILDPEQFDRRLRNALVDDAGDVEIELGTREDGSPLRIPASAFDRHTQFAGTTGGGKTYCFEQVFRELAIHTNSAQVLFDVTGNAYHRLKRWAYAEGLEDRLVLIDPSETRLICGVNPVQPWPDNHFLQAVFLWHAIRLALDSEGISRMPLLGRWMQNVFYGLINTGLTMHEAPYLVDFNDAGYRKALIPQLRDESMRSEYARLEQLVTEQSLGPALREWNANASAAHRRILQYTGNERLRLMLGTAVHVVDWDQVLDERKLVLVNLHGVRDRNIMLAQDDSRMLGLQLLSELIEVCWRREDAAGDKAPPTYAFVDECQHFVSPNLERILSEGRQFNLRLMLAHRVSSELKNELNESERFMSLVSSCTQCKFVFGGLGYNETKEIAWDLYGHHLDPLAVKDEIVMPIQLQEVREVEDVTSVTGGSDQAASGDAWGSGDQFDPEFDRRGSSTSSAHQNTRTTASNWSEAVHRHLQSFPKEPEYHVVSREFWRLEDLLHQVISRIVRKPPQHAVVAVGKEDEPIDFRVKTLHEPAVAYKEALGFDLDLMRTLPYYTPPKLIEEEIQDRKVKFLTAGRRKKSTVRPEHKTKVRRSRKKE